MTPMERETMEPWTIRHNLDDGDGKFCEIKMGRETMFLPTPEACSCVERCLEKHNAEVSALTAKLEAAEQEYNRTAPRAWPRIVKGCRGAIDDPLLPQPARLQDRE